MTVAKNLTPSICLTTLSFGVQAMSPLIASKAPAERLPLKALLKSEAAVALLQSMNSLAPKSFTNSKFFRDAVVITSWPALTVSWISLLPTLDAPPHTSRVLLVAFGQVPWAIGD
jgi:hypothetical protein